MIMHNSVKFANFITRMNQMQKSARNGAVSTTLATLK